MTTKELSDYDRGYEQGFRAALLTADLTKCDDEKTKQQLLESLKNAFSIVYKSMHGD